MLGKISFFTVLILCCALFIANSVASQSALVITSAYIKKGPPRARVLVGYATIENKSDKSISLISAESEHFLNIELHKTTNENGVMHMSSVSKVEIPAHSSVALSPGGLHLMMFRKPSMPIHEGDQVNVSIKFDNGDLFVVPFQVQHYK